MNRVAIATVAVVAAGTLAAGTAGRDQLMGRWTSESPSQTWAFEQKPNQDELKVSYAEGGRPVAQFECNTMGRECRFKDGGKTSSVSIWFSGPKLVELETRGGEVIKRRFQVIDGGDKLEVEIIRVVPAGKPETIHLNRVEVRADTGAHPQ